MKNLKNQNRFYVYIHKKLDGTPFYVGKGCRNRAYTKHYRNDGWHEEANKGYTIEIIHSGLTNEQSLELERTTIDSIGIDKLCNIASGSKNNSVEPISFTDLEMLFELYDNYDKYSKDKWIMEHIELLNNLIQLKRQTKELLWS